MKKYLKTPEEVISALKEGKTVHSDCGEYKMIDGLIVFESGGLCTLNAGLMLNEKPFVKEAEPFKIEVGKFYKTRDGNKARCFVITPKEASFTVDGKCGTIETYPGGLVSIDGSKGPCDIIGPWEEE